MGKAALVGGTLDEDVLHLARVQEPVGKEQYGRDANRHDDQDGHGERGVENFNIAHSDEKYSKKLFSVNSPNCKVYLEHETNHFKNGRFGCVLFSCWLFRRREHQSVTASRR